MPNKLTDSEIKKALEESISFDEPYESNFTLLRIEYIKNALDLINRLQEKNSNLTSDLSSLQNDLTSAKAENEVLVGNIDKLKAELFDKTEQLKTAKTAAYKEFAKFCIDKSKNGVIQICDLPDYVKEMVGDDNESKD